MYRDEALATATQVDALRGDLAALEARLDAAQRAREAALSQLERIRDGVDVDPELETERGYRWTLRALRSLAVIAAAAMVIGLVPLLSTIIAEPLLTAQGAENFVFHVRHGRGLVGLAAAGFVVVIASPWLILPWIAARGLSQQRRSGWTLGVIACALFLPTPFMPAAACALVVLLSRRVRTAYFARG